MDRDRRFELLSHAETESLLDLAEEVLAGHVSVALVIPPHVGTLMLRLLDPVSDLVFNAGEVLVTEAQVAIGEHQGYGLRMGRVAKEALAAAVVDAAVEAQLGSTPRIMERLAVFAASEQARQTAAWRAVEPSRVVFEQMG